jgi:hypothetical protein
MTDPAGKLHIRIGPDGVHIRSTRPVRAAKLFVGRGIEETARVLPALFSICATAQAMACAAALERALGLAPDPRLAGLRRRLVEAETLREHLWRVLLDWPRLQGGEPDSAAMAQVMGQYTAFRYALAGAGDPFRPGAAWAGPDRAAADRAATALATLVAERVLGEPPADWLARVDGLAGLADWSGRAETVAAGLVRQVLASDQGELGRSPIAPLPALSNRDLDPWLSGPEADSFVACPTWDGAPRETSPLTRNLSSALVSALATSHGNGILTRVAAQLLELAQLAAGGSSAADPETTETPASDSPGLGPDLGLALVQAARGLLVHRVRIADGRVVDYRILAPTEWSFHPQGTVACGLVDLAQRANCADLLPLARFFITAVDPCVDFDLELAGPGDVQDR